MLMHHDIIVLKVMDRNVGITFNETVRFRHENTGEIQLATSPVTMYDTYIYSYYYNEFHIRVDYNMRITLNVSFVAFGINDTLEVFDGPWSKNVLKQYIAKKSSSGKATVKSSGFQVCFSTQ